jgi:hypothetical protein
MRLALAGLCILLGASPVSADWTTTIGPVGDGQGDAAVMNGQADGGQWVQLWCRGDQQRIAILVNDGQNDDPSGVTATVEFAADTGSTWRSEADFYRHDDGWLGLSYRNIGELESIVDDIINAQGNIAVAILPTESAEGIYMTANAVGSTKAGREFAAFCFNATPAAAPQAAPFADPAPLTPDAMPSGTAAWEYATAPDPNGGTEASLVADLDQGGYLYAYCDGRQQAELAFVSQNPQTFPYTRDDTGLQVAVQIDGQETLASGEFFSLDAGTQGILFNNRAVLQRLIGQMAGAQGDVAMMLSRTNDPLTTRWPAVNLNGLQQGAAQFIGHCWGNGAPAVAVPSQPVAPQPVQEPAPQVAQPATPAPADNGNWVFTALNDDPEFKVEMTVPADNADAAARFACNQQSGTRSITIYDGRGFAGDGTYAVTASVDDDTWTLAPTRPVQAADGTRGVMTTDPQILSLADQLSVPKREMRIELVHAGGARKTYRFTATGSERPATDLYFGCN